MCALGGLFELSQRFFDCFYIEEELRELDGVVRGSKVVAEGQRQFLEVQRSHSRCSARRDIMLGEAVKYVLIYYYILFSISFLDLRIIRKYYTRAERGQLEEVR